MTDPSPIRITLSGDLGSGKSSVGRRLAEALRIPYFSAGALFREIGRIDNLDALNTNLAAENNTAIDFAVDKRTREIDRTVPSFIIDSRMAWHFVQNALKVFLSVSRDTAAHRIMGDGARASESYANHATAVAALGKRRQSETTRYRQLYGVDIVDFANYDLVVVTDDADVADVTALVLAAAKGEAQGRFWLPKSRIVPMMAWEEPTTIPSATPAPLPLTVVHNFGFYFGGPAALSAALATEGPFAHYQPAARTEDGEAVVAQAKRMLTPGGLGRWAEHGGAGRAFAALLGPARP
jgi:predicted cytidylate kinase